jgi:anti-sigma factor RsiW
MMHHLTNEEIIDYLHGALPPAQDASAYEHLETCEDCRREYNAEAALGEELRTYAARTESELPPAVKAEIWKRVRDARSASGLRNWLRPVFALPAAAALAAAAYFGTVSLIGHPAPAIAASYYLEDHAAMSTTIPFSDRIGPAYVADAAQ